MTDLNINIFEARRAKVASNMEKTPFFCSARLILFQGIMILHFLLGKTVTFITLQV